MDASAWTAVVAAAISLGSAVAAGIQSRYSARQAEAAEQQTDLQRQQLRDAAQPYVWADFRPDLAHGSVVRLVVKNEGPTVATNVTVKFDPPLPGDLVNPSVGPQAPLSSLPPGREMAWWMDSGAVLLNDGQRHLYRVTITGTGPGGPMSPLSYDLDLQDFATAGIEAVGSLAELTKEVKKLRETVAKG